MPRVRCGCSRRSPRRAPRRQAEPATIAPGSTSATTPRQDGSTVTPRAAHQLAHCRSDLLAEGRDRGRIVTAEDERADAVLQHQAGELVHPLRHRSGEELLAAGPPEPTADVEHAADLGRVAPCLL